MPTFEHEAPYRLVCGVDEAGRGPLAGNVVAAAVIFPDQNLPYDLLSVINDSKKMSEKLRERVYEQLCRSGAMIGVGQADPLEIDKVNILQATFLAMRRAIGNLPVKPEFALIDGNKVPPSLDIPAKAIVKGDSHSFSIAAASIVAKVTRDRQMKGYADIYPEYGFDQHKGYPTASHIEAIKRHGILPIHRKTFSPLHTGDLFS